MTLPATPRATALKLLIAVTVGHRLLSDVRDKVLAPLSGPDRARTLALTDGTLRDMGRADRLIGHYLRERPPDEVLAVLRLAVHELANDPDGAHGIVHEAVTLAKADAKTSRHAGLVNAVLRNILRAPAVDWASLPPSPLPKALKKRLITAWGKDRVAAFEVAHQGVPPLDLTVNGALHPEGELLPSGSLRVSRSAQITTLPGFAEGHWWVQDAAAALPAKLIEAGPGTQVIDLCAAPGGKTMQLAAMGAEVTAVDLSAERLKRLTENLARTGLTAKVVAADVLLWQPEQAADGVLLDAPCSATGTIRRHPDLPYAKPDLDVSTLTALQARLLVRAATFVKPGGQLVYATCSLLKEEGEAQVAPFLAARPDYALDNPALDALAGQLPNEARIPEGLRTTPDMWSDKGGMDGFFITVFRRRA
jgi:16S rRNA (cytosine967-C5)-methyltransferase